jgi:beta-phosphoglucomutase
MKYLTGAEAILFDFDGVLMRSIEDHYRSWNAAFAEHGVSIGWEEFAILEGQSLYTIAAQLGRRHAITPEASRIIGRRKNELYLSTASLTFYEDVTMTLDFFSKRGLRLALVTGAHRDRFDVSVDQRFKSRFDTIITADDVQRTKPDPEPFLRAASKLNRATAACVVVENAPLGIQAAKQAGMVCIALTTTLSREHLKQADHIVDGLKDLVELFRHAGCQT